MADDPSVRSHAGLLELENVLQGNLVAFQADDFRDLDHLATAVAHARLVDDDVNRRGDLLADGADGQFHARHEHHGFEPGDHVARRVGVNGGERTVVAGVHGLEHVQRLGPAALAHDDAVGPHAQGVAHQVPDGDGALALDIGRPRFEPHHMRLVEFQFRGVFDGDDAVGVGKVSAQHVEQARLSGSRAARNDDVLPEHHADARELGQRGCQRAEPDQVLVGEGDLGELADRQAGADQRQGVNDGVHAGAVGQPGVHVGLALVNAAADRGHDALDNGEDRVVIEKGLCGRNQLALLFHVHLVVAVDHDLRDFGIGEEFLEGPQPERFVEDLPDERLGFRSGGKAGADVRDNIAQGLERPLPQFLLVDA